MNESLVPVAAGDTRRGGLAPQRALPERVVDLVRSAMSRQLAGPLAALAVAVVAFSLTTDTFLNPANVSLVLQQSVVIGTLALGQTLIILTAGIDLSAGAIMVLGTVLIARLAGEGNVLVAVLIGFLGCALMGAVNGLVVARWKLPPFIVTLGTLTVIAAATRLYTSSASYPVTSDVLRLLGSGPVVGGAKITYGTMLWLLLALVLGYALTQTAWGTRVYAVGDSPHAARLTGIKVSRVLFSVYLVAGLIYAVAALAALGRTPIGDPSGYQTANLDTITAVVIGGTSLFGGRGGVAGTVVGALIVSVLQNGLTQAGIDSLYQQVAVGVLVIAAVGFDQLVRRRNKS